MPSFPHCTFCEIGPSQPSGGKQAVLRFYTDPQLFHDVAKHVATLRAQRAERLLGRARSFMQTWVL